jgi:hypothetical protein
VATTRHARRPRLQAAAASEVTADVPQAVLLAIAYIPAATAVLAVATLAFYRLRQGRLADVRAMRAAAG